MELFSYLCLARLGKDSAVCVLGGQRPFRDPSEPEGEEVCHAGGQAPVPGTDHQVETTGRFHGCQLL